MEPLNKKTSRNQVFLFGLALILLATAFLPAAAASINETFDETTAPYGWTVVNNKGDAGWRFDNPGNRENGTGGEGGFAMADSDNAGKFDMDTELRTPLMNFSDASSVRLTFNTIFFIYQSSTADVDVSADGGNTWTNVWHRTESVCGTLTAIDLTEQAAGYVQVMIRFRYRGNWEYYWEIDNVKVEGVEKPEPPTYLAVTSDGVGIMLNWTDNSDTETAFEVERSVSSGAGFAKIGGVKKDVTTFADAEGLVCNTIYYYRVRAVNAGDASEYGNVASAKTGFCAGRNSLSENFDSKTRPAGWTAKENISGMGTWHFDDPQNFKGQIGTESNFVAAYPASDKEMDAELRTPVLNLSDFSEVSLTFKTFLQHKYSSGGITDADVSTDGGHTWTNVWRRTATSIRKVPFEQQTVDISEQAGGESNVMIRFRANVTGAVWIIDDVSLTGLSLPVAPANLTAVLGRNSVVNLAWQTDDLPVPRFEVERSVGGAGGWNSIAEISNGATAYVDADTESDTNYSYRVRAKSSAGVSFYSNSVNVTTEDRSTVAYDVTISYYSDSPNKSAIENIISYFADAVYEMSNGSEKLGRVKIYTGGAWNDEADIVWVGGDCRSGAIPSGYGIDGYQIETCDGGDLNDGAIQQYNGYTLGHEWGHYFYGLYDEYVEEGRACGGRISSPCQGDTAVEKSIMNNQVYAVYDPRYSVNGRPLEGDLDWLNLSTPLNNTGNTAQHRVYSSSAWETVARRPSEDPPVSQSFASLPRVYHSELVPVAPGSGKTPSLEVSTQAGRDAARSKLTIVWTGSGSGGKRDGVTADSGAAHQFLIDRSDNISEDQLNEVKDAVKQQVEEADIGDAIGVVAFCDEADVIYPLTMIQSEADKNGIKSAIDSIAICSREADMDSGIRKALDGLTADVPENLNRSVYLISPGLHETEGSPFAAIPDYNAADVRLHTFGYGAEEGTAVALEAMADQTDGEYRFIGAGEDLQKALIAANQETSLVVEANIRTGWEMISLSPYSIPFHIDSTLGEFGVHLSYLADRESASFALIDPNGVAHEIPEDVFESFEDEWGADTSGFYSITNPENGTWKLRVTSTEERLDLFYWIDAEMDVNTPTFSAYTQVFPDDTVEYPDPILVSASVSKELPITGAVVRGRIEDPGGDIHDFALRDDGTAPDPVAGDGYYSAILDYAMDGDYYVTVMFDNSKGTAMYTAEGFSFAPNMTGSTEPPEPWPVEENFERFAEIQVTVTGAQEDDHSGWHENDPTVLTPDNIDIPGSIDYLGDVDTFKITVPDDFSGEMIIRVDNLGLGMDPYLYIYARDWGWEFDAWLEEEPSEGAYLSESLDVSPGETFYVEVWHLNSDAGTGVYDISAGPRLASERASSSCASMPVKEVQKTYHSADYNPADYEISISELLRVIQMYNSPAYHCDSGGEDKYALGTGDQNCTPHASDYNPQNWKIDLTELLRMIQLYNSSRYQTDPDGEDGFSSIK
ncbi:VWA domain-containing protein [Desulfobacterales bacterium HSG2]|nr:VWA domain-containing protein [Desulfobacterales bacterium HSG2]